MIFISYADEQHDSAAQLKTLLDESGFESFLAHEDIDEGEEWRDWLWDKLHKCTAFVGLVSADFNASAWCQQEVGIAMALNKPRMFVKLTSADPAGFAGSKQAIKPKAVINSLLKRPRFRNTRIFSFIAGAQTVTSYQEANRLYDSFASDWEEMSKGEKERWLESAQTNNQITTEGFKMGPFYKKVAKELNS